MSGAVLEGIVLENKSGRPAARASVSLEAVQGMSLGTAGSVLTDSGGRFGFRSLPGGTYLLSAKRSGYATARYGQKRWNGSGAPIVLDASGQFFAELRLLRLAVVTGEVLDENQLGLSGHPVYAYRSGQHPLRMVAAGSTDDRGVYRIAGLEPGRYYIRTGSRELEDGRGLLPTFYGQTTVAAEARQVEVALDREAAGIDIQPLPGRLGQLTGSVLGGAPASAVLYSDTGKREASVPADGGFHFDQLAPGMHLLVATSAAGPPRAAYRKLRVGEGVTDTVMQLARLPAVRLRCEEKSGRRFDPRQVSVFLRRKEPPEPGPVHTLHADSSTDLPPGEYEAVATVTSEFYIESFRMPRPARQPNEFEAMPNDVLELTLVLSTPPAAVRGNVLGADGRPTPGAPVFLNAIDPELRARLQVGRSTRADHNGEYRFFGLPPGRYQLFSSFEIPEPQEAEWGALPTSSVALEKGEEAVVDLKLIGGL